MLKKARIAVLVSGGGTNLQALIDACASGVIKSGEIAAVISSKEGAYALRRAEKAGIPTAAVDRRSFSGRADFEKALAACIDGAGAQLIILAGFMCILSEEFTRRYDGRIINVHPSLIPSFCGEGFYGLHVHEKALEYGVKLSGATVHFVSEECDGGPIILQKAVPVEQGDTPETLQRRIMEQAEWKILPQAVSLFCAGKLSVNGSIVTIKE